MALYILSMSNCPTGWTKLVSDNNRFIYVTNTDVTNQAGAYTRSHQHAATDNTHRSEYNPSSFYSTRKQFTELELINIRPAGILMLFCRAPTLKGFPAGTILISDSATCPSGWAAYTTGNSKYILFTETDGDAGTDVAGNLGAHTHTTTCTIRRYSTGYNTGCTLPTTSVSVLAAYTDLYHIKLMLCRKQ